MTQLSLANMELLPVSLVTIGLSLVAMEMAAPGLYLAALGAGALVSGVVGYFYTSSPLTLLTCLSIVSVAAYFVLLSSGKYGKRAPSLHKK